MCNLKKPAMISDFHFLNGKNKDNTEGGVGEGVPGGGTAFTERAEEEETEKLVEAERLPKSLLTWKVVAEAWTSQSRPTV